MVHPFLFLQFLRDILTPILFPAAAKAGGEALKTAHTSVDTITYTWLVMAILIILSILATKGLKNMPGKLQNFMELIVGGIEKTVVDTMGKHGLPFFPLIATLFLFILVCNLISLIPGFYPPTGNLNTTAALAVIVFTSTHVVGVKEHLSRVLSLSLRLFGNIGGHEIVVMVFFALVPFFAPLIMTVLGLLVCIIQSIVFMMLAMMYIQGAVEEAH
jgi:F-type H+-transporting ATPase subunit a